VAGVAGILCLMTGVYMSFVNFTFPEYSWQFQQLWDVGYTLVVAMASFSALVFFSWRLLPKTPFYNMLVMSGTQDTADGYTVQTDEVSEAYTGLRGTASSMLRPTGRGRFGKRNVQVVTHGDFMEAGTPIVIVEAEGNRYVVEEDGGDSE
jgi:membrane-bound serine protease (ClpP class)